ncbi:DUF3426 domain-containing protein [Desulfohalobium retbaense]|uniref:MJ0042 family finger-like protein n=1 Tax=Desulfohalobium retbaense (strain ATCC 49708 / DSM 5692 / JCM 16813 / HR100) TaxID=485915 RepID=C8X157_DESRD|nr:DUF3426 domain-containing protein [Desulfohalobium retbaense]ACV68154.1 MJ0042 family finger-like protein [Desulfohalobium retbaense DSM 5692]
MIITCPNCEAQFQLAADRLSEKTVRVRCTWCGHVFVPEQESQPAPTEMASNSFGPESEEEESGVADTSSAPRRPSRWRLAMLLLLLILVLAGAGWYYWGGLQGVPFLPGDQNPQQTAVTPPTDAELSKIELRDVRQYFVDNEKLGDLFVIEGKAVNTFAEPKGLIKIEAQLFDANSTVVAEKTLLCGNTVSLFQLQVLSRDKLESALSAKVGVLTKNTSVPPQESVPFMAVFFSPPSSVEEFGLRVVQAKTPPNDS